VLYHIYISYNSHKHTHKRKRERDKVYICIQREIDTHTTHKRESDIYDNRCTQNFYTILPLQGFVLEKRVGSELESDLDGFLVLGH
jgi:hypothetical protein